MPSGEWDRDQYGPYVSFVSDDPEVDDSTHYLERDELAGLKTLHRSYAADGIKSAYVFVNKRGQPFGRMGIARMIELATCTLGPSAVVEVAVVAPWIPSRRRTAPQNRERMASAMSA